MTIILRVSLLTKNMVYVLQILVHIMSYHGVFVNTGSMVLIFFHCNILSLFITMGYQKVQFGMGSIEEDIWNIITNKFKQHIHAEGMNSNGSIVSSK